MTLDEAFELLGVGRDSEPDDRRRAYLRLLKKHKPETDPEGFRRLREAYELAAHAPQLFVEALPETNGPPIPMLERLVVPPPKSPKAPSELESSGATSGQSLVLPAVFVAMAEAQRHLEHEEVREAGEVLVAYFDASHESPAPLAGLTLRVFFMLHAENRREAAGLLFRAFHGVLRRTLSESSALRGQGAVVYLLAGELDVVSRKVPLKFAQELAIGMLIGEFGAARRSLLANTKSSLELLTSMERGAPQLLQLVGVRRVQPKPSPPKRFYEQKWTWALLPLIGILSQLSRGPCNGSLPDYTSSTTQDMSLPEPGNVGMKPQKPLLPGIPTELTEMPTTAPVPSTLPPRARGFLAAQNVETVAKRVPHTDPLLAVLKPLLVAIPRYDCTVIEAAMRDVEREVEKLSTSDKTSIFLQLDALRTVLAEICPKGGDAQ